MNYKQGLELVAAAASFGLDMQTQVHINTVGTPTDWYPHVDCDMPPHIAIWSDYETWCDFGEYLRDSWGYVPYSNYCEYVPESVTGDEYIYFFYLRDED